MAHRPAVAAFATAVPASERGTERLYEVLEARMARPEYVEELARSAHEAAACPPACLPPGGSEVLRDDWWALLPDGGVSASIPEATGDFVVVEREDVVEALAAFIAAYIVSLPEARSLEPRQLQAAVVGTMHELRKGRVRRLWDWGRFLYRAGEAAVAMWLRQMHKGLPARASHLSTTATEQAPLNALETACALLPSSQAWLPMAPSQCFPTPGLPRQC